MCHCFVCLESLSLQSLERELRATSSALSGLVKERQQLQDELQEQIKQRAKAELNVKDLEQNVQDDQTAKVIEEDSGLCVYVHVCVHTHAHVKAVIFLL